MSLSLELHLPTEIRTTKNPFLCVKTLLSYPLWNWVQEYYVYVRDFTMGMDFINYCTCVINDNLNDTTPQEQLLWSMKLSRLSLALCDHMNLWDIYIDTYEDLLLNTDLHFAYKKPVTYFVKEKYIIKDTPECLHVHFLHVADDRYEVIKRKVVKQHKWKNIEHIKKHQADKLTAAELELRYHQILEKLYSILDL